MASYSFFFYIACADFYIECFFILPNYTFVLYFLFFHLFIQILLHTEQNFATPKLMQKTMKRSLDSVFFLTIMLVF